MEDNERWNSLVEEAEAEEYSACLRAEADVEAIWDEWDSEDETDDSFEPDTHPPGDRREKG